jgi:hypothetical protein
VPVRNLDQDAKRSIDRAAATQQGGREVEVDVRSLGEVPRHPALVAGPLKLLEPPEPDPLGLFLTIELDFRRRDALDLFHTPSFERKQPADVPPRRDIGSETGMALGPTPSSGRCAERLFW